MSMLRLAGVKVSAVSEFLEIPGMQFAFSPSLIGILVENFLSSSSKYNPFKFTMSKNHFSMSTSPIFPSSNNPRLLGNQVRDFIC